ncbi:protein kinase [Luteimonas sp. Y-2-2-4F]|nr:serine/threonine-protein kinase [Luteimonas sp. Y-2-2-4F]MCD9032269.1 protein kinase [Luteimonas sp. Y-2-2-4F]
MTGGDATRTGLHALGDLAPDALVAGRFRIVRLLGVGGMGLVYLARDEALSVPVALKVLRPELADRPEAFERFRQELLLARQVSSPRVVRIHDIARHDGRWLISMDYVEGEPLDRLIDREGPLPLEQALRLARQIAQGLAAAHARGVVHRDLKPANALIDREGDAYVNDFGVARSLVDSARSRTGTVAGTPDYLSPEQARGAAADPRSDLYALGLILHEMLTGQLPFAAGTAAESLGRRLVATPPPVDRLRPGLPGWVVRLVDALLHPRPGRRPQSADAVVAAIEQERMPRTLHPGRRATAVAAVVLAAVGLAAGTAWWLRPGDEAAATAAAPALQRLLVLPPQAAAADDAPRLDALAELLRDALAGAGVTVVDGERTWQAQRQLDPDGSGRADPAALRGVAAADRMLVPRLRRDGDGWRVEAELLGPGDARTAIAGPRAGDAAQAWAAWMPRALDALGVARAPGPAMPPVDALDAYGAGLRARRAGEYAAARTRFAEAAQAAPRFAAAWRAQAEAALAVGEEDDARALLAHAQRATATTADDRGRRQTAAALALLDGDPAAALAAWAPLAEAHPDDTYAALQLARAQGAAGELDAATATLRRLAAADPDDPRIWFELGKFSILRGDARAAVDEHLLRAMLLFRRGRDAHGLAETANALGVGYGRLGQTAEAEAQYRQAVELRGALGNRRGVAISLRNLAGVRALRGDFDEAAEHLAQALALLRATGNRGELAATENELGLLEEERGDHRAALDAYRRALAAWEASGDAHGVAETLNHIGFAHFQLGAYDSAQAFWGQAADAYAALGDLTGDVRTTQNLGLLDVARGRWDEARERLQRSLQAAEAQQMVEEAAVSRRNLAELALWQGRIDDALAQAEAAQAAFRHREDRRGTLDAGLLRARALLAAEAGAQAGAGLDALVGDLAEASLEQRAIAALLRGDLARRAGDAGAASAAWAEADRLAARSGIPLLQLDIALRRTPARADLDAATARLGHAGLRLQYLEQAIAQALAGGDATAATAAYREAQRLLRAGAYLRADRLHALGAQAAAAAGDAAAADAARADADAARLALRERVPDALRDGFDAATAAR